MSGITWLHLSDWHQTDDANFDRAVVADALIKDIEGRVKFDKRLAQVDFVAFSGDAAQNGKRAEFETTWGQLFAPVLNALGLGPDRLFVVPGNHDLDRDVVYKFAPPALQKPLTTDAEIQEWLCDDVSRDDALRSFRDYRDFFGNRGCGGDGLFGAVHRLSLLDGAQIAIIGLNSAWMCGRKGADGKVDDKGRIVLGEPQVLQALNNAGESDLRIAVMHHHFEWLADFDRRRVEGRIRDWADFVLCGHAHDQKVDERKGTDGNCIIVPGGACFSERNAPSPWNNSYNFVHLDRAKGKGMVIMRRWDAGASMWEPARCNSYDITEIPARLKLAKAPRRSRKFPIDLEAAERRYRDLLLESCRLMDLANLPEQDRHVATRSLALNSLYVPLRAHVDVAEDEKSLERVETRRHPASKNEPQPVGTRLKEAKRLVILGDPGAGKSTLTRWITTAYLLRLQQNPEVASWPDIATLPEEDWLPILIRCRELNGKVGTLEEMLGKTLRANELSAGDANAVAACLLDRIQQKRALLILDGLDEVAEAGARSRLCQQIDKIAIAHPNLPIIATSRIVGYRELGWRLGRGFEHLTLAEFNRDDKDAFATKWCSIVELPERISEASDELISDIHSSDRIERLTGNPMLLTTMALVKRKVGRLPQRRCDLYDEAVGVLLNWRSDLERPLDAREALPQLQYIAYAMCARRVQRLPRDTILELLAQMRLDYPNRHAVLIRSPEEFLPLLEARTGLMMEVGRERHGRRHVPVWEFRHLTFQEFLAAQALVDGVYPGRNPTLTLAQSMAPLVELADAKGVRGAVFQVAESWREVLRLCSTLCKPDDAESVLLEILGSGGYSRAVLAALCLADEPDVSDVVAARVIKSMAICVNAYDAAASEYTSTLRVAALELAAGRWRQMLKHGLISVASEMKADQRAFPGRLWGIVSGRPRSGWRRYETPESYEREIDSKNQLDAVAAMCEVWVWAGNFQCTKGLVAAIFRRLSGSAFVAHMAIRALVALVDSGEVASIVPFKGYIKAHIGREDEVVRHWIMGFIARLTGGSFRVIISRYLDGVGPWIDPVVAVDKNRINYIVSESCLLENNVVSMYQYLASEYGLILAPELR